MKASHPLPQAGIRAGARRLSAAATLTGLGLFASLAPATHALAADAVLNLYSARHYQTDEALYADFTRQTGIKINRIEGKDEELIERIKNEGANSPADVLLLVDAARLAKADELGLLAPLRSPAIEARIPKHLRAANWAAFSTRARILVYNKAELKAEQVASYEDLAKPALKGKICTRSGSHPYNLSLVAALVAHHGESWTEEWAKGVVANLARDPKGGDTDQIKSVAAGECGVAITNSYYLARLMRSDKPADQEVVAKIGAVWPNQKGTGTHVNVSGGGVARHAPNRVAAIRFLEYLAGDQAQIYLADGNNEWPVVATVKTTNPALEKLGAFKADTLPIADIAARQAIAQKVLDRAGFR